MGAAESIIDDQAQFRVRFTRSRGLAALFERPENTYQWSGYGTLRVEPRGIRFQATRRRAIGLPRTEARFVAGREIDNVYREGDGVRVEFRDDARQNVLNFWAEDSAAAASIVEQLPTVRTVEVEESRPRSARPARRELRMDLLVMAVAALIVLAVVVWLGVRAVRYVSHSGAATTSASGQRGGLVPVNEGASSSISSGALARSSTAGAAETSARPIPATELKVMQQDFDRFAGRSEALRAQFDSAFRTLLDGNLSQSDFADGVEHWLIPQWVSTENTLREQHYPAGSPREEFRASLIAVTSNWRSGLEAYVSGLREQESRQVRRAFAYIGAAEESQREAKELVEH